MGLPSITSTGFWQCGQWICMGATSTMSDRTEGTIRTRPSEFTGCSVCCQLLRKECDARLWLGQHRHLAQFHRNAPARLATSTEIQPHPDPDPNLPFFHACNAPQNGPETLRTGWCDSEAVLAVRRRFRGLESCWTPWRGCSARWRAMRPDHGRGKVRPTCLTPEHLNQVRFIHSEP